MSRAQRKTDKKGNKKDELASLPFNSKTRGTLEKNYLSIYMLKTSIF